MTSRRWVTVFSVVFLSLVMAAPGSARAQFGFPGLPCPPSLSEVGLGFESGPVFGISPYGYDSFGVTGYGGFGGIGAFPLTGHGRSIGWTPQTTTSFQPLYDVITGVSSSRGRAHRIHRRLPRPERRGTS